MYILYKIKTKKNPAELKVNLVSSHLQFSSSLEKGAHGGIELGL